MLKDQMWKLVHVYPDHRRTLVTARLVMMGLKLRTIVLDNLSTYVCCIYKTEPCYFPATIETFARDFGMLLRMTSQIKQLACSTVKALEADKLIESSNYKTTTNKPELLFPYTMSPKKAPKSI
ncbi:hypothetical protein BDB00DRAFT_793798 [Zychaea mexicana]|uniref:uncharacterized protein n=1 Tax=Zychaea mexicana TaxID=64656 RepID=UPI0022FDCBE8|nr:uncharacterized protein BDB00DRAFT_793798 [Zychaea mexicana]KAI9467731.1 hypothetical protein BDB00DRAFT_793798 [Zychaea mexicana]